MLLIHPILPQATFLFVCFPGWKNSSGKYFADVEEMNKKWQKHKKASNSMNSKTLEQWKNILYRHSASNGEHFEGDWSLNMQEQIHNLYK